MTKSLIIEVNIALVKSLELVNYVNCRFRSELNPEAELWWSVARNAQCFTKYTVNGRTVRSTTKIFSRAQLPFSSFSFSLHIIEQRKNNVHGSL